jgi:hypothetical protein
LSCENPILNNHGKDTFTPRLKSGAIGLRQLATLVPRRDFALPFFVLFVPFCGYSCVFEDHEWTGENTNEPRMNQPSPRRRRTMAGKLQIYADNFIVERCLPAAAGRGRCAKRFKQSEA